MNGDTIQIITNFVENYVVLAYSVIPLGVIFEGDLTLLLSGIFSHLGSFSLPLVVFLALSGSVGKSLIGYSVGRYLKRRYPNSRFLKYLEERVKYLLPSICEKPFWCIFISKFLYGFFSINYSVMIFLGYLGVNLRKYVLYDLLASAIWVAMGTGIGYFFSFTALQITKNFQKFILVVLLLILAFFLIEKIISFIIATIEKYRA